MLPKNIVIAGVAFLILSLPYSCSLFTIQTKLLDTVEPPHDGFYSSYECETNLQLGRAMIAHNETVSLRVSMTNTDPQPASMEVCEQELLLSAPAFTTEPTQLNRSLVIPANKKTATIAWILTPKKEGLHEIAIEVNAATYIKKISVTNVLGLTPKQAQILSTVGTFLGGPITLASLWGQWTKFQMERKQRKELEEQKAASLKNKNNLFSLILSLRNRGK